MYRLTGSRRSYDWGSTTSMFNFLGRPADVDPFAELWLGAHTTGPATVHSPNGPKALDQMIAGSPTEHLGQKVRSEFGQLPYLLKLLAPARPLSLQVHPDPVKARIGYEDEQLRGIPLTDPKRTFKDKHHKPEMVYALTRFEGLVGFRDRETAALLLADLDGPLRPAYEALTSGRVDGGMQGALARMLELTAADVDHVVSCCREKVATTVDAGTREAYETVGELAAFYPGDVGAIISLLLNRVVLQPGQLVFLGAGIPHAYLSGFGLELMANSDNVLRLGLTSKHVDSEAMFHSVDFASSGFNVESISDSGATHVFTPPVPEFALSISRPELAEDTRLDLPGEGPRILICVDGTIRVSTSADDGQEQVLQRGESVFVPAADGTLHIEGSGTLAQAFVP